MNNLTGREGITLTLLIVVLAAAAAGLVWLAIGLFRARSLIRREFSAYFVSPIAYAVLVVFLLVTGHLFAVTLGLLTAKGPGGTESPMQTMFADERFWLVFLFIPPLLTMRLFAEERSSGTLEMLMTAPLRDWQVVLCKYLACLAFYVVLWLPTLVYLPALLGAQAPLFNNAWSAWSILFVAGLVATLVGLAISLPSLAAALVAVLATLVVFFLPLRGSLIMTLVIRTVPPVAGLGLVILSWWLPRVGTRAQLISVACLVIGGVAAGVGGWFHYHAEGPHLFEIPVMLDPYPVLWTYVGMFLAGAMFLAIGLFISSLVRNQMVAAILALAVGLVFIGAGFWRPEVTNSDLYNRLYFFSVPLHFDRSFTRGLLDTRPMILYASSALFCLFLTVRSLEARRWQ